MSQNKNNETIILASALLLTVSIVGGIVWWFTIHPIIIEPGPLQNRISFGEKSLTPGEISPVKKAGVDAIAAKSYDQAIANFTAAQQLNRNDPETLIFLNNARIKSSKSYTIVASVPIGTDPNTSLEVLRGIAQVQTRINTSGGIKGVPLKVGIANDDGTPEMAKQIASSLVSNSEVLGVVGPITSDCTLAAGTTYTDGKLVAISPTSTSVKISDFSPYVFRTVPSDLIAARSLANYMVNTLQKKNAAVFFSSQSNYSQSLKSEFVSSVLQEGGQVSSEFDLSKADFSAAKSIQQATTQGAEVLMLAPDVDQTLDNALKVIQINQKKLTLLAGDDIYTPKTLKRVGEQAVGMVLAVPGHIDCDPKSDFPSESWKAWHACVGWRTATSDDATVALIAALERNPTRSGVQAALTSPDFSATGAFGTIRFLASGDRNAPVQLVKIVPGSLAGGDYDFEPVR
ncbi:MAG: ABC transporter substrate-binding protein [Nostoc sp.]|uniref:ABC transporter substrate-binding protein n=1 Tax=Nostoc sp. TaxID=1180 RepID=UPI002FF7EE6E